MTRDSNILDLTEDVMIIVLIYLYVLMNMLQITNKNQKDSVD